MQTLQTFLSSLSLEVPSIVSAQLEQHRFDYATSDYQIDDLGRTRIKHYLDTTLLKLEAFGDVEKAGCVIAFAFGESDKVNIELAKEVDLLAGSHTHLTCYAQQEIEAHCRSEYVIAVKSDQYQITKGIAQFVAEQSSSNDVVVVAQAWHALRCMEMCQAVGFNVVALRIVEGFPMGDPQPWVRNPINWIIKESHRDIATGDEISDFYRLR